MHAAINETPESNEIEELADQLKDNADQLRPNEKSSMNLTDSIATAPADNNKENKQINENKVVSYVQIVAFGLLIVVCTIQLGLVLTLSFLTRPRNFETKTEIETNLSVESAEVLRSDLNEATIPETLLETPEVCYVIDIFMPISLDYDQAEAELQADFNETPTKEQHTAKYNKNAISRSIKYGKQKNKHNGKRYANGKHLTYIKNKSANDKGNKQQKDIDVKKSSKAEPIIYLFAMVFIYLLVKAGSDINQHYKTKNKNDIRLRRCSLQSYAQAHKQDRRASKGISAKSLPKF